MEYFLLLVFKKIPCELCFLFYKDSNTALSAICTSTVLSSCLCTCYGSCFCRLHSAMPSRLWHLKKRYIVCVMKGLLIITWNVWGSILFPTVPWRVMHHTKRCKIKDSSLSMGFEPKCWAQSWLCYRKIHSELHNSFEYYVTSLLSH